MQGDELEIQGQETLQRLGVRCIRPKKQVPLIKLDPAGPYGKDEHLELDYLVPFGGTCLIGEITARSNPKNLKDKDQRFRKQFDILRTLKLTDQVWQVLGVPDDELRHFRNIVELRGFSVATDLELFDVGLPIVPGIARFYKADWNLLTDYSNAIGEYALYFFLQLFDITPGAQNKALVLREADNALIRITNKKIAGGNTGLADIYTFEISPYELFPLARVYRRDRLPELSTSPEKNYQRALMPEKLRDIRNNLLKERDFMFPNSILVVLAGDCNYQNKILSIPMRYGAMSVIDGQHRLFSYADKNLQAILGNDSKIMVTAIQFRGLDDEAVRKYSARTFIEINTNQTRVRRGHLDAIAYEVLGETYPKAIAARILLLVNQRKGSLYGLFDTNQTGLGKIQTTTVMSTLASITDLGKINKLVGRSKGLGAIKKQGYENLFGASITDLTDAQKFIQQGVASFEHYFSLVSGVFRHDWPEREKTVGSSLEYAKMFAAFVKMFQAFILEGKDWEGVQQELKRIQRNIMKLRRLQDYNGVLLDPKDGKIPSAQSSTSDDFHFLEANRKRPTSIRIVRKKKH